MQNSDHTDKKIVDIPNVPQKAAETDGVSAMIVPRVFEEFLKDAICQADTTVRYLSMLMIVIDSLDDFVLANGSTARDLCLKQVFDVLRASLKRAGDLAVQWEEGDFACILSDTDAAGALEMSRKIGNGVIALGIPHATATKNVVTVSIETVSDILTSDTPLEMLVAEALEALSQARKKASGEH